MLGWMDDEALARTLTTGRATYWSRSRQEHWVKGETSGHRQWVKEVRLDCDGDTLLVKVDQEGPACHTGDAHLLRRRRPARRWLTGGGPSSPVLAVGVSRRCSPRSPSQPADLVRVGRSLRSPATAPPGPRSATRPAARHDALDGRAGGVGRRARHPRPGTPRGGRARARSPRSGVLATVVAGVVAGARRASDEVAVGVGARPEIDARGVVLGRAGRRRPVRGGERSRPSCWSWSWPEMGDQVRPPDRTAARSSADDDLALWKALDEGRDPTA